MVVFVLSDCFVHAEAFFPIANVDCEVTEFSVYLFPRVFCPGFSDGKVVDSICVVGFNIAERNRVVADIPSD